jgi:hypothetical protein
VTSTTERSSYFAPWEFDLTGAGGEDWYSRMSPMVLDLLEQLRERHGAKIEISPHPRALGRYLGESSQSDHNVDRWKEVRAADVFPDMPQTPKATREFLELCREAGVSAVGVYPHWRNRLGEYQIGFHIGYRPDRYGNPGLWGLIRTANGTTKTVSIHDAIALAGRPPERLA